jgi:hypothetical protein
METPILAPPPCPKCTTRVPYGNVFVREGVSVFSAVCTNCGHAFTGFYPQPDPAEVAIPEAP